MEVNKMTAAALFENTIMDSELEQVSGGTYSEYRDFAYIMFSKSNSPKWKKYQTHWDGEDDVVDFLREEMGIKANLHGSAWGPLNPFGEKVAEYTEMKTGKALSHQEVLGRVKKYFK